jgi:shikimate kinase
VLAGKPPQRSVVLVGFMAAGKSKIGSLLAERLHVPLLDTDRAIEESYRCSISDIFHARGEAEFRRAERELIQRLMNGPPQVIALGGGAFVDEANREALSRGARTVWLDTPFELILERLSRSSHRPLADNRSEPELRALWEQRRSSYAFAHIRIDTSDADVRAIVERIMETID